MGTQVGRIEKEFVFKALLDEGVSCDVHGSGHECRCRFSSISESTLTVTPVGGSLEGFASGDEVRVFFYLRNNYHAFGSRVREADGTHLLLEHPQGVYRNLQRKYERVKPREPIDVSFSIRGSKVELNFPKSDRYNPVEPPEEDLAFEAKRIQEVVKAFRAGIAGVTSGNKIVMFRDRLPRTWEERTIVRLGKSLWIPSTAEDFPATDPFPDQRIITRAELVKLEEEGGAAPYVVASRLGNILYEKTKHDIFSELWVPVLYNEYVVGYLRAWNTSIRRERISRETVDFAHRLARILSYSLVTNGYFKVEKSTERRYEAPIVDLSASGLLFAHTSADLAKDLLVHEDISLTMKTGARVMTVGARVMRKFRDAENAYFGVLFLRIQEDDFNFLFQYLYGKPFDPGQEGTWEGGAPPPPLDLS